MCASNTMTAASSRLTESERCDNAEMWISSSWIMESSSGVRWLLLKQYRIIHENYEFNVTLRKWIICVLERASLFYYRQRKMWCLRFSKDEPQVSVRPTFAEQGEAVWQAHLRLCQICWWRWLKRWCTLHVSAKLVKQGCIAKLVLPIHCKNIAITRYLHQK